MVLSATFPIIWQEDEYVFSFSLIVPMLNRCSLLILVMGYRLVCERHNVKQYYNTIAEAKAARIQHQREGCLEAEIKKPGQK